jgi:glycosyltransferase involved in cell wall biosynthesis
MALLADLHCHSKHSDRPSQFYLRWIGARESYTEPRDLYRRLKSRGMDLVTITDHDTIEGGLEIAHEKDVFLSEELTCYFPEDRCKVHILVYGIDEAAHRDLLELRHNVYELSFYLHTHAIAHSVAHPLFGMSSGFDISHVERLLLLFSNFEEKNGSRSRSFNELVSGILDRVTPELLERLAEVHDMTPIGEKPWRRGRTGGSDDHTGLLLGSAWTSVEGARDPAGFIAGLSGCRARGGGIDGTSTSLAHSIYHGCYHYLKNKVFLDAPGKSELISAGYVTKQVLGEDAVKFSFRDGAKYVLGKLGLRKKDREEDTLLLLADVRDLYRRIWSTPPLARKSGDFELLNEKIFHAVALFSNKLFERLLHDFGTKFIKGHLSESIGSAGSLSSLFTTLTPYMIASAHQHKDRGLLRRIAGHFEVPVAARKHRMAWFTDTYREVNGVTRTVKRMAGEARAIGKDLTVVCSVPGEVKDGVRTRNFPPLGTFSIPGSEYQKIQFPSWLEILRYCEVEEFTRLVVSTPGPIGLSAVVAGKVLGIRTVGVFHTDIPLYARIHTENETFEKIAWKYVTWFYNQMDAIYIASDYYREYLVEHGFDREKMRLFPKAVDTDLFSPTNRAPDFWHRWNCDNEVKLLYVGRIVKEKNLDVLAHSFKMLARDRDDILLVIVGEGPYRRELERMLAGERVLFTGVLEGDDLARAYASSDIFVFPSTTDTYGNAVLEAQASGLPAVVTNAGGAQEVIRGDRSGIVTGARDPGAFAQAIGQILESPSLMQRMSSESRRLAEERHWGNAFLSFWNDNAES